MKQLKLKMILVLFLAATKPHAQGKEDTVIKSMVESKLLLVENYIKDRNSVDYNIVKDAGSFLFKISSIESEADGSFAGQNAPTYSDWKRWSLWYKQNKLFLLWDDKNKEIIISKRIKI